jgi:hypothetical protein
MTASLVYAQLLPPPEIDQAIRLPSCREEMNRLDYKSMMRMRTFQGKFKYYQRKRELRLFNT